MKKLLLVSLLARCAGCSSTKGPDMTKVAERYYDQKRTDELIYLSGVNRIAVEGSNMTVRLSTPNLPLSIIPRDPSVLEPILHTALAGFGIWQAGQAINTLSERPQVVNAQLVRPEVVRVDGSAASGQ